MAERNPCIRSDGVPGKDDMQPFEPTEWISLSPSFLCSMEAGMCASALFTLCSEEKKKDREVDKENIGQERLEIEGAECLNDMRAKHTTCLCLLTMKENTYAVNKEKETPLNARRQVCLSPCTNQNLQKVKSVGKKNATIEGYGISSALTEDRRAHLSPIDMNKNFHTICTPKENVLTESNANSIGSNSKERVSIPPCVNVSIHGVLSDVPEQDEKENNHISCALGPQTSLKAVKKKQKLTTRNLDRNLLETRAVAVVHCHNISSSNGGRLMLTQGGDLTVSSVYSSIPSMAQISCSLASQSTCCGSSLMASLPLESSSSSSSSSPPPAASSVAAVSEPASSVAAASEAASTTAILLSFSSPLLSSASSLSASSSSPFSSSSSLLLPSDPKDASSLEMADLSSSHSELSSLTSTTVASSLVLSSSFPSSPLVSSLLSALSLAHSSSAILTSPASPPFSPASSLSAPPSAPLTAPSSPPFSPFIASPAKTASSSFSSSTLSMSMEKMQSSIDSNTSKRSGSTCRCRFPLWPLWPFSKYKASIYSCFESPQYVSLTSPEVEKMKGTVNEMSRFSQKLQTKPELPSAYANKSASDQQNPSVPSWRRRRSPRHQRHTQLATLRTASRRSDSSGKSMGSPSASTLSNTQKQSSGHGKMAQPFPSKPGVPAHKGNPACHARGKKASVSRMHIGFRDYERRKGRYTTPSSVNVAPILSIVPGCMGPSLNRVKSSA
ncbi:hypothetical protein KP509_21G034500 [Ceratopteris richardii]|nr:hypothetical protein KP509_21G034500 [Ceratopteris richardii]